MIKDATVNRSKRSFQPTPQFLAAGGFAPENNDLCIEVANSENSVPIIEANVLYHSLPELASRKSWNHSFVRVARDPARARRCFLGGDLFPPYRNRKCSR